MENPTKNLLGWGIGLATLALFGLIMITFFGNLPAENLGFQNLTKTVTVTNESFFDSGVTASVNTTSYNLSGYNASWSGITLTAIWNATDGTGAPGGPYNYSISTANATVSSGQVVSSTALTWDNVSLSYTYSLSYEPQITGDTRSFNQNYTNSILNIGAQLPTTGTILGVSILLVILISILLYAINKMGGINSIGGSKSGGLEQGNFG